MQAHPIRRQAIRRRGLAEARSAEAVAPERGVRGTYKLSPERRAKGGLGCPVSHPEHGDTLRSDSVIGKSFAAKANANQRKWVEIDSPLSTLPDRFAFISVDLRLNLRAPE